MDLKQEVQKFHLEEEKIAKFNQERRIFLAQMKVRIESKEEEKNTVYEKLNKISKLLDLENMEMKDECHGRMIPIQNTIDFLVAIGSYLSGIRNVFITTYNNYNTPYNNLISDHEEKIIAIFAEEIRKATNK